MHKTISRCATMLTYLGILPFYLVALLVFFHIDTDKAYFVFCSYSVAIAAFISGIHWAIAIRHSHRFSLWLLLMSNVLTLLSVATTLFISMRLTMLLFGVVFILLLCVDMQLYRMRWIDFWFFKLRCIATTLVVVMLGYMMCVY